MQPPDLFNKINTSVTEIYVSDIDNGDDYGDCDDSDDGDDDYKGHDHGGRGVREQERHFFLLPIV